MSSRLTITDWRKYHPLTEEQMKILFDEGHSHYEIAAISCPPEATHMQWMYHYYYVINLLKY